MSGDERKALIISDLLANVNSAIDGSGRMSPWLEAQAAVLGDALAEYGYPALSDDFREWLDIYVGGNRYMSMPRWDSIENRIKSAARELARGDHEIQNPNGSGQGYAPSHVDSPFHETLLVNGFDYSHSTRVWRPYYGAGGVTDTRYGPENTLRHSYRSGARAVGVEVDHEGRAMWEGWMSGHGRRTRGATAEELRKYLRAARHRDTYAGRREKRSR